MRKRYRYVFILFALFISVTAFSQSNKIKIKFTDGEKSLTATVKNGITYISSREFAEALSIKYYYNPENKKIVYSLDGFKLKLTANNPFIIRTTPDKGDEPLQITTPTVFDSKQILFPVDFVLDIINPGYKNKLNYNKEKSVITVYDKGRSEDIVTEEKKRDDEENTEKQSVIKSGSITVSEKANGTLVSIKTNKKNIKHECSYKRNTLSLLLKGSGLNITEPKLSSAKGLVKNVKVKLQNNAVLVTFDLNPGYESHDITYGEDGTSLLLTIRNDKFKNRTPVKKGKWDFDVIVIDAGHGGKDAGAIGVNGIKEKDVNLAIALKLGKLIEKNISGVKVVYTRKTDTFVELYRRGKIANENSGKLFISIHCNSTPQKPSDASGTEIYLLRPGRTESAIKIAERENSVIKYEDNPSRYQKLTDENFILVSMAHSSYMKYSEKFSDYLNNNFMNEPSIKSRGVKQAGFYVLIGASMPGVLVESGFISNPHDAKLLGSKDGQSKIANSVFEAVRKFKEYYDKVIEAES